MPIYEEICRICAQQNEYYTFRVTEVTRACPRCGGSTDRLISLCAGKVFEVFSTRNILPDGSPVTVRGSGQLRQLENEHKVKLVDDPRAFAPQTRIPPPY